MANRDIDLASFREIFKDQRQHIAVGKITKLGAAPDRSCLRVQVLIFDPTSPNDREVVAMMGWDDAGPECGLIRFPEVDDLVLVAFVDGDAQQAYVIKRLTSQAEKIPLKAVNGHTVLGALAGKNMYVNSDTAIHITKPGDDGTENLVLGQQLKMLLSQLIEMIANHQHITSAPGTLTSPPQSPSSAQSDFLNLKASPVDDSTILSNIAFTEKG